MSGRRGRRAGESGTRLLILDTARRRFSQLGYERATIRDIAREAAVDPALVHHYFGTKERLFVVAVGFPAVPSDFLKSLNDKDPQDLGGALVGSLLELWERDHGADQLAALLRSAVANERAMRMFRQFLAASVIDVISTRVGSADARFRAALVASQLVGLAMARYVMRVPGLADAPAELVAQAVGGNVQRYLTGELVRD